MCTYATLTYSYQQVAEHLGMQLTTAEQVVRGG